MKHSEKSSDRYRTKFGAQGSGVGGEPQGNVQPDFVGVFDTVAALGSRTATILAAVGLTILIATTYLMWRAFPWWITAAVASLPLSAIYWFAKSFASQIKTFADDKALAHAWWHPRRWGYRICHAHLAWWSGKHYDRYVDREVSFLRHAMAIDEDRFRFPRVGWGRPADLKWHQDQGRTDWLVQVWFAGNHSDIGGSYPEEESRLSDIALRWMVDELKHAMGQHISIIESRLVTNPDAMGLQHSERTGMLNSQPTWLRFITFNKLVWRKAVRNIYCAADLHPTVCERLAALHVPQMGEVKPYRPESLKDHNLAKPFFANPVTPGAGPARGEATTPTTT